jgi:hypothetical protein
VEHNEISIPATKEKREIINALEQASADRHLVEAPEHLECDRVVWSPTISTEIFDYTATRETIIYDEQ